MCGPLTWIRLLARPAPHGMIVQIVGGFLLIRRGVVRTVADSNSLKRCRLGRSAPGCGLVPIAVFSHQEAHYAQASISAPFVSPRRTTGCLLVRTGRAAASPGL